MRYVPNLRGKTLKKSVSQPIDLAQNVGTVASLVNDLQYIKQDVILTVDKELERVDDKLSEVDKTVSEIKELAKGEKGEDADEQKIADWVLSQIPTPKDGKDGKDGVTPEIDIEKIAEIASTKIKPTPASLKIIKESVELKDEEIVPKLNKASNIGDLKLSIKNIKDWDNKWGEIKTEISRNKGYLHGGGDTVGAGTNITIDTVNGVKIINATGGGTGIVQTIVAGSGITVDSTDPANPIVSATSGGGDVVGPASATDGGVALFDGTTGKLIKNSSSFIQTPTGDVGIGTISPQGKFQVFSQTGTQLLVDYGGLGENYYDATNNHHFRTGAGYTERMTLLGNGNLGVGVTVPLTRIHSLNNIGTYTPSPSSAMSPIGGSLYLGDGNFLSTSYFDSAPGFSAVYSSVSGVAGDIAAYVYGGAANARSEAMRIIYSTDATPLVGIGTTSPTAKLSISDGGNNIVGLLITKTVGGNNALTLTTNFVGGNAVGINPFITGVSNAGLEITLAGSQRMVIDNDGNVGIGTTTPSNKLHVYTTTGADGIATDGTNNPTFIIRSSGTTKGYFGVSTTVGGFLPDSVAGDVILRTEGGKMLFGTNGGASNSSLAITNGGNVGIGTNAPGAKLTISDATAAYGSGVGNLQINNSSDTTIKIIMGVDTSIGTYGIGYILAEKTGTANLPLYLGGGNVGLGVTLPTATLHLKAGTATANTAPLKFTAGTALTTPEAGVFEFSNSETGLTFTAVSTRRAVVLDTATQTLTNKRITRRLTTTNAPGATPTTNTDNVDIMNFTGLATAITSMTTNLSGTPVDGDKIEFRFTDNGTARAITWGASFGATTVALPTTTVISTMLRVGFEWNGSIWQCIAVA